MPNGSKYSAAHNAKRETGAWGVIQDLHPFKSDEQCKGMIREWVKAGRFGIGKYRDEKYRALNGIISVQTSVATFE